MLRWIFASLHLLALPLGLGAVWMRARALRTIERPADLRRVFAADNAWGAAAGLWLVTGLVRVFASLEKPTTYYLHDRAFYLKMGLFLLVLLLEVRPMATLIRWRAAVRRESAVDTQSALALARISEMEAAVVVLMVFVATALARGLFY